MNPLNILKHILILAYLRTNNIFAVYFLATIQTFNYVCAKMFYETIGPFFIILYCGKI